MGAQGLGAVLALPIGGWLTDRYGARPVVLAGVCALVLVTLGLATVQPDTTKTTWALLLAARGMTSGFVMMPAFSAAYLTIAPALISRATALSNTIQRMASSLGVAVVATIATDRVSAHLPHTRVAASVVRSSIAWGFDDALLITVGLTMLALPATMLLRRALPIGISVHPPIPTAYRALAVALGALGLIGLLFMVVIGFGLS